MPAVPGLALASTVGPIDAGIVPALLGACRIRTGITPAGDWYRLADHGAEGNVATARETARLQRYTLPDRATAPIQGDEAQRLIAALGLDTHGQPLSFPRAPGWSRTLPEENP